MSVKIRLTRTGKSHQISYRVAVQDTHTKRDGNFLEILGYYNPYNKPELEIDKEKLDAWIKKGAKPTMAVESLLKEGKLTKKISKRKIARDKAKEEKAKASQAIVEPTPAAQTDEAAPAQEPTPKPVQPEQKSEEAPKEQPKEEPKEEKDAETPQS